MPQVFLASPLHDPKNRILPLIIKSGRALSRLYGGKTAISLTATTTPDTEKKLTNLGFTIVRQTETTGLELGDNYRLAMKTALSHDASHIHLVDFDRALHWANRFPSELRDIISYLPSYSGFVSFVRTKRAFNTHPLIQKSPEITINSIASEVAKTEVDIMSGAFAFDRNLANLIVKESRRTDYGIYAELLTVALKHKNPINTIEVEGLEWETPDQFQDKIEEEGYSKWLADFESLPEWEKRVKLIEDSSDVLF